MDSSNMRRSLESFSKSNSKSRQGSPRVANQDFEQVAGFNGRGGYHGEGGHGGNQLGPKKMNPQAEMAQLSLMKQSYENMKHQDHSIHPVANQSQLANQAYSQRQDLHHTNREQRAVTLFKHNDKSDGFERHRQQYKDHDKMLQGLGSQNPSAIQMVTKSRQKHQRFATIDQTASGNLDYPKISFTPFEKPKKFGAAAGYGNGGPQMISQEHMFGERKDEKNKNLSQVLKTKLPALRSNEDIDLMGSIVNRSRESIDEVPSENVFSAGPQGHPKFNTIVEQMITGQKAPVANPKNKMHTKLTASYLKTQALIDNTGDKTFSTPSIFQQIPFSKNKMESSIMSNAINRSMTKHKRIIDMDTTQPSVDQLMQESVFTKRATPYVKGGHFDSIGSIKAAGEENSIGSEYVSRLEKLPNTDRQNLNQNSGDLTLQQTLDQIMSNRQYHRKPQNDYDTQISMTPNLGQHLPPYPEDIHKEISKIHMYDSIILSKQPSPRKRVNSSTRNRNHLATQIEKVVRTKNSSIDIHTQYSQIASKMDYGGRHLMRSVNTGELSTRGRQLVQTLSEKDGSQFASSSAMSRNQTLLIGHQEVPTMKGAKVNQLSPITKKMNKLSDAAFNQMEAIRKKQKAQKELRETLWLKAQAAKLKDGSTGDESTQGDDVGSTVMAILGKHSHEIKILQNEMKSVIAPEEDKYTILKGDSPDYETVDCLPDMLPVYLKLPASALRSPMQFEILLGNVNALQVLMSTEHPYPVEERKQYEKETLLFRQILLNNSIKREEEKKKKPQKNSILVIEASAAFNNQKPKDEAVIKKLAQHNAQEGLKKRQFKFGKPNFKENFNEGDVIYITLLSQNGGQIKIKAGFPNKYGGFGPADVIELYNKTGEKPKVMANAKSPEDILNELQSWYKENLKFMDGYQYIFEAGADFTKMNKAENLQKYHYHNAPFYHQQKMIDNQVKRDNAAIKAIDIYEARYYKNLKHLSKWEDYREDKIELTHIFIKVMKRKNYYRRWLRLQKQGQIIAKVFENLFIRRELNRVLYASYHVALRFKNTYLFKYRRSYGFDMTYRRKNELRRALNFTAMTKYAFILDDTTNYLGSFIFKTFLVFNTSQQFTKIFDNLCYCQQQRRNIQIDRENRFEMVFQRLSDYGAFMVSKKAFGAKSQKKKSLGYKVKLGLKNVFPKKRNPEAVAVIKAQLEIREKIQILECKAILWSIQARELTIVKQLLKLVTLKDENKESIHKDEIEGIQARIEKLIKNIKKIYDKKYKYNHKKNKKDKDNLEVNEIEFLERQIYGIQESEMGPLSKMAAFKSADDKTKALLAANKYSTYQVLKTEKNVFEKKYKPWIEKYKQERVQAKKKARLGSVGLLGGDVGEDDDEDEEGMDGEGMEGDEMENADGMEGEGNEGDMEGAEGMEGMDGEGMDGDMEAGDGMDGEEAKDGDEGMDGEIEGEEDGSLAKDGSQENIATEGDQGSASPSKTKKKKGSVSKSKTKKVKKEDPNKIEILEYKKSDKTKKWILSEKVANPENIMEYIKEKYPKQEPVEPIEPPQEGEEAPKKVPHGVNAMTVEEIKEIVHEMYYKIEKNKLKATTMKKKYKFTEDNLKKMLLHIALNFEIKKANEDIQHLNTNQSKQSLKESPSKRDISPEPVADETPQPFVTSVQEEPQEQEQPVEDAKEEEVKQESSTPKEKPLMMQPCLKKKSNSNAGSQGDKKSQNGSKPPTPPKEELKVEGSQADATENLPEDVPVQFEMGDEDGE